MAGFPVHRSTNAKFSSEDPQFDLSTNVDLGGPAVWQWGPNPNGLLGQPWVVTDHSAGASRGNVYLLCSVKLQGSNDLDVMFARSTDQGDTWALPVRVNDDASGLGVAHWFGTMSVAPNGRIDVIWNDTRNDATMTYSELFYSYSVDEGQTWSTNVAVSWPFNHFLGYPNQQKLGDYYDMISVDGGANVAYAATLSGEQDVYFLRIPFDCNGNDVGDADDVTTGTSADCNGNIIPDECEPADDCNGNSVQDICDIAGGTSQDCTLNEVADECEPDCNVNGVPDSCDLAAGTGQDCNLNGAFDSCELTGNDCNSDGVPDDCELLEEDCNANGVVDECDVQSSTSLDCNGNLVPDECELASETVPVFLDDFPEDPIDSVKWPFVRASALSDQTHSSPPFSLEVGREFDVRGWVESARLNLSNESSARIKYSWETQIRSRFPDPLEVTYWTGFAWNVIAIHPGEENVTEWRDSDQVLPPDALISDFRLRFRDTPTTAAIARYVDDVAVLVPPDCNHNGILDECDIANGTSTDCNGSLRPDECEFESYARFASGLLMPFDHESPQEYKLIAPPVALEGVLLRFEAHAMLYWSSRHVDVRLNGMPVGKVFQVGGENCSESFADLTIPASTFNSARSGGVVTLSLLPSVLVMPFCANSSIAVNVSYLTSEDCNGNQVLDQCEVAAGSSVDCNGNLIPDECDVFPDCNQNGDPDACDITGGTSQDCTTNGIPDECEPDCNHNGVADSCDILLGTSRDCNANLIPEECEFSADCNGNESPDACDIVLGTSADCAGEGVPDECEPDCNRNGVPDSCDILAGTSSDSNQDGIPEECQDCDQDGVLDWDESSFVVIQNTSAEIGVLDTPAPVAHDIHWQGSPIRPSGLIKRFQVIYRSTGSSPGTMTVRFFRGVVDDSVFPTQQGLLAEYTVGELSRTFQQFGVADVWPDPPIWVTGNMWMEVQIDRDAGVVLRSGAPTIGESHGLLYDRDAGALLPGPVYMTLRVDGTRCSRDPFDCDGDLVPDVCELDCGPTGGLCDVPGCGQAADCNGNQIPDGCEPPTDCNENGTRDSCDIDGGTSADCNTNSIPDECEPDCNENQVADSCDVRDGTSEDCNGDVVPDECEIDCNTNGVPDSCDILQGTSADCLPNGVPDECEPDCDQNGVADNCDLAFGTASDCNGNDVLDSCESDGEDCDGNSVPDICDPDCNENHVADACDISQGTSGDCNNNNTPDECETGFADCNLNGIADFCEPDCNQNDIADDCELRDGLSPDCNGNQVPDSCDVANGTASDCNGNSVLDSCESPTDDCNGNALPDICETDCNANSIPDDCDIAAGTSGDCNSNNVPDECEPDCNGSGIPDDCDVVGGTSADCNSNLIPDECEDPGNDCNSNGAIDLCEPDCNGNGRPDDCDVLDLVSPDCNENGVPDSCDIAEGTSGDQNDDGVPDICQDCDGDIVPDDVDPANILFINPSTEVGLLSTTAPVAQDIHVDNVDNMGGIVQMKRFWVIYRSTPGSPGTMIVRFYEGSADDSVLPQIPGGLILEYVVGQLSQTHSDFGIKTVTLEAALPSDLWMEVEITQHAGVVLRSGPPTIGHTHALVYDRDAQSLLPGPLYMNLRIDGFGCAPDCNGNSLPDNWEVNTRHVRDCNLNAIPDSCEALGPAGDLDGSGSVGMQDFATFVTCFEADATDLQRAECACSDFSGDGAVDLLDFATFVTNFGV